MFNNAPSRLILSITLSCILFGLTAGLLPLSASAQSLVPSGETTLTFSPQSPLPQQEFTVRVEAYTYDLTRARISWIIDGAAAPEYDNTQAVTLTAPAHGDSLSITARVTEANGTVHTATDTVVGQSIDLVVESSTRVPHFYAGRALPSAGSAIRLVAQPSLYAPNGTPITPDTLIYTWRIGNNVAKSGQGVQTLTTTMPRRGALQVGVTVETSDGDVRHTQYQAIEATAPVNVFYEDNPLYGIARNALPAEFTLLQNEMSVRAEPYFVAHTIFDNAEYTWSINGTAVSNPNADPQVLTLRKSGGRGAAEVKFDIRNLAAFRQFAISSFVVHFEN